MIEDTLAEFITDDFSMNFTPRQALAVKYLSRFLTTPVPQAAFILKGYAGTGKTTLVGALVKTMKRLQRTVVLMAPTGRAAKVFSAHAGERAYTIHKTIYRQQTFQGDPKAEVEKMMQSGKLTQQQLNQLQAIARQFQGLLR